VVVANGNVKAVRLRTLLHIFTGDVSVMSIGGYSTGRGVVNNKWPSSPAFLFD
jgi:hypothetical protein